MASMTALVATTTPHCRASQRVVTSQAQARIFVPALQKPTRTAVRPALRLNSRRNVKTYAQDTETAAGALKVRCEGLKDTLDQHGVFAYMHADLSKGSCLQLVL